MSAMENMINVDNDVHGTGSNIAEGASSGRCPKGERHGPGRHLTTARTGWTKEMNIAVTE